MPAPREIGWGMPAAMTAVLLVLLFGYLGAYYALLEPSVGFGEFESTVPGVVVLALERHPSYRLNWPIVAAFFSPAHQLDRQLRPGYWYSENWTCEDTR